jgi:hypothetical protein
MWQDLLTRIEKIEAGYGGKLQKPAGMEEVERLKQAAKARLNAELPEKYLGFLRTVNGLYFNGLVIYGVDASFLLGKPDKVIHGFVETNEIWRQNPWQKQYLFFGDSDIGWYCLNLSTQRYEEQDKPSGTVMTVYDDFDSMLEEALKVRMPD